MNRNLYCALVMAFLTALPAGAAKLKAKEVLLPDGFPPITEADKTLTKVPYAQGAPAAVLLEARQNDWFKAGDDWAVRIQHFRRVKILTDAGIEKHGDFTLELYGDWRVKKVDARTVLPDGTLVDAAQGVFQEKSDSGYRTIRVAFPQVRTGAILDLRIELAADYAWYVAPVRIQESIPVLQSRFSMMPPTGLRYRTLGLRIPAERLKTESVKMADRTVYYWVFENTEPLVEEANLPPISDIAQTLLIIPEEFHSDMLSWPIAKDWKSWSKSRQESWNDWIKQGSSRASALAKEVTAGRTTSSEKAEAIRKALRTRVRVDYLSEWANQDSPDKVLSAGSGTSGAIAGLTVAMLRAVGVEAHLSPIRRRSSGLIPIDFPVPILFDDVLVRIPSEKAPVFYNPAADMPVGMLPGDCTDLYTIPLDGKTAALVKIPDFLSSENRTVRNASASLDASGTMTGESSETFQGVAAERWRRLLRDKSADARREAVREHIQEAFPGARLESHEILQLDEDAKELTLKARWVAEGYATPAGKRLLVDMRFFGRVDPRDWAAAERKMEIDLGENYDVTEMITLTLPPEAGEWTTPPPANMNAGQVGLYEASYERAPGKIVAKRHMRLDMHRFSAQGYGGLKRWFGDIAAYDERPVALAMK